MNNNLEVFANTYSSTYKLYRKGQFKKSLIYGKKAFKRTKRKSEKAKILKILGISSYMLGSKKNAMSYFKTAIKLNPRITISSKEVLDPKIVMFFNKIKSSKRSTSYARKTKKTKRKPIVASKGTSSRRKKTNPTSINLKTPSRGSVLIDGIFAGSTNQNLEVRPGILKVTIQAKGYKSKTIKVKAIKNKASGYNIKLVKKVAPKPKRVIASKKRVVKKRYPKISKKIRRAPPKKMICSQKRK